MIKLVSSFILITLGLMASELVLDDCNSVRNVKYSDDGNNFFIDVDNTWETNGTLIFTKDLKCHISSSGREVCDDEENYNEIFFYSIKKLIFEDIKSIQSQKKNLPEERIQKYQHIFENYDFKNTPYEALFSYLFYINDFFNGITSKKYSFKSFLDVKNFCIIKGNVTLYNNIAYYLQKAGANKEAIYILEKIIAKFPQRTVAYYNLGDAYWELREKVKAREAYVKYVEQMMGKGKGKKVPIEVLKRVQKRININGVMLNYPSFLSVSTKNNIIYLIHDVEFKHEQYLDGKYGVVASNQKKDFYMAIQVYDTLDKALKEHYLEDDDLIEREHENGYRIRTGVEGVRIVYNIIEKDKKIFVLALKYNINPIISLQKYKPFLLTSEESLDLQDLIMSNIGLKIDQNLVKDNN